MSQDIFSYELKDIPLSEIDLGDRVRKDMGDVAVLATDIAQFGLHHPILVIDKSFLPESNHEAKPYLLLAGERRFQAALLNKWPTIPAKITQRRLSKWEITVIELHENLQRKSMTPLEEGQLKDQIHTLYQEQLGVAQPGPGNTGHTVADTAKILGESKANTSMDIKIAKYAPLIPELKDAKTKSEARKLVKEFDDNLVRQELAKRQAKKLAKAVDDPTKTEDSRRTKLINCFITGDFFDLIQRVEERSIDLIELDPDWGIMLKEAVKDRGALTASGYEQVDPTEYEAMIKKVALEAFRALKDNSWLICWYSIEDWHKETRHALEEAGFNVTPMPAIWVHDSNYTATPAYRLGQRTENFFYARKGTPKLGTMGHGNTFTFRTARKNERTHIAEKPIELYEDILKVFLGDRKAATTITGFAGSGNFLLAADNLEHNVIGFDLTPKFKDDFVLKVTNGVPGQYKTYK